MNKMQSQVAEFNKVMGCIRGFTPEIRDAELRAALIEEEAKETVDAIRAGDFVGAIDGLCDLLYVTFGAADVFGIDIEEFYDEVHRTNMLKVDGPISPTGKKLKPEGWQPPNIYELLTYQIQAASIRNAIDAEIIQKLKAHYAEHTDNPVAEKLLGRAPNYPKVQEVYPGLDSTKLVQKEEEETEDVP